MPALRAAGHDVRLLVRSPERALGVLARRGIAEDDVELVVGDMVDAGVVAEAVAECDAAIHAAAAIGLTGHDGRSVLDVNTIGARTVVDAAVAAGHDPVIHVSSVAVFVPPAPHLPAHLRCGRDHDDHGRHRRLDHARLARPRPPAGAGLADRDGGVVGRGRHLPAKSAGRLAPT